VKRLPLAQRRAHLADVALQIAARSGIDAVTVRAVAREAGVSLGTVHYCFDDKEELLREMGRALVGVAVDPVRGSMPAGGDFRSVVHAAAEGLMVGLRTMEGRRVLSFELSTAGARSAAMNDVARVHIAQVDDMAVGVLTELADRAGVTYRIDVPLLARIVVAFIDGLELRWLVERDDDATLAAFHELADIVASYAQSVPASAPGGVVAAATVPAVATTVAAGAGAPAAVPEPPVVTTFAAETAGPEIGAGAATPTVPEGPGPTPPEERPAGSLDG
jgi:AcrR family transcriptional regulator